jgi:hypothetical protein
VSSAAAAMLRLCCMCSERRTELYAQEAAAVFTWCFIARTTKDWMLSLLPL